MFGYLLALMKVQIGLILLGGSSLASAFSVKIHAAPKKVSGFNPGQNVTLTCQIQRGGPADMVNWFKDNQPIRIQNDVSQSKLGKLSLLNISRNDSGNYNCTAWKGEESSSDEFNLRVYGAPVLKSLPELIRAPEGEDWLIPCQADGWPRPNITWILEDTEYLSNGTRYEIRRNPTLNKVTLIIKSVDRYHEGYYTCKASNIFGTSDVSFVLYMRDHETTNPPKPPKYTEILVSSPHVLASKGSNVTLTCNAININTPNNAVDVWKFNGRTLNSLSPTHSKQWYRIDSVFNWTLLLNIYNFSEQDAGVYECGITDERAVSYMNTITLYVDEKDDLQNISTNWKTVMAEAGTSVELKCLALHPTFIKADTFWLFQGTTVDITPDKRYKMDELWRENSNGTRTVEMAFWISQLSVSDFGNYSCVVNTTLGLSSDSVFLVQERGRGRSHSTMLIVIFPVVAGGLFLALAVMMTFRRLYKKRRDLKLQEKAAHGEFSYDVFVTFSGKDRQWVMTKLIPLLEGHGLKYCIHSRDFELGRALVDNMADSIYSSRKVLAVMSKNYLNSRFCKGELEMALYRSKVGRDGSLLVVTIDGLKKKKLPKVVRESTFVDYHSETGRSSWEKKLIRFLVQADNNPNEFNTKL